MAWSVRRSVSELAEEHGHAASSQEPRRSSAAPQLCTSAFRSIAGLPSAAGAQPKAAAKATGPRRTGSVGQSRCLASLKRCRRQAGGQRNVFIQLAGAQSSGKTCLPGPRVRPSLVGLAGLACSQVGDSHRRARLRPSCPAPSLSLSRSIPPRTHSSCQSSTSRSRISWRTTRFRPCPTDWMGCQALR